MRKYKILQYILITLWALSVFFIGYIAGRTDISRLPQRLIGKETPERFNEVDFSKFWEALDKVESQYVSKVDYAKLVEGAISGMVGALGDPFSAYINQEDMKLFEGEINGTFEGVGAEISVKDGELVVVAPLEGSPAERAGVRAGDIIKQIDGENVAFMTMEEAILKIRGTKGSWVKLLVVRGSEEKPREFKIRREAIKVDSVKYALKEGKIAYVKILRFDNSTKELFETYAKKIKRDKAKGIILDMRNNPGGYLESATDIASEFISDGVVAIEEFKDGKQENIYSAGGGKLLDLPMVVLVNGGSASGSEIVAGAIRDRGRGILIGEKTFGKGTVQELDPLSHGGALKITIAKWLTPNAKEINQNGLTPNIEVKWSGEGEDTQLGRAMEEMGKIVGK